MKKTLLTIRIIFFLLCILSSYLICYSVTEWDQHRVKAMFIGASIGFLVILVDVFLKGFSLRGMTALTFGLFIGWLMAYFISNSPLFENGVPQFLFLARLSLFIILMYLGAVIALRGKDDFNLVIPYIKFVPHNVQTPLAVVDTSALIDGRLAGICESNFLGYALIIPRFVLDELHYVADSPDDQKKTSGRKGLATLNALKNLKDGVDLRIHETHVDKGQDVDSKLIFLAQSLKAKLITTDYNLAQMANFHGVEWLNINALAKILNPDINVGTTLTVELMKTGKESDQAVGYLNDGSMVVVNDSRKLIGTKVEVEVQGVIPSAGGKMVFAKLISRNLAE